MNTTFWLGFAAYLIPTFPLGYFWHLKIFKGAYDRLEIFRADMIIPMGLTSMLIQAAVFSWMYPRLFSTAPDSWMVSAGKSLLVYGVLAWSFVVLPVAAKYRMASVAEFVKLETVFTLIQFLVVCPIMAFVYRGH
jgi:hypothetical protein